MRIVISRFFHGNPGQQQDEPTLLDYVFAIIAVLSNITTIMVYVLVPCKIQLCKSAFIITLWSLFFVSGLCGFCYFMLFALNSNKDAMITFWMVALTTYSLGHFLFSQQYLASAIEIDSFLKTCREVTPTSNNTQSRMRDWFKYTMITCIVLSYLIAWIFVYNRKENGYETYGDSFNILTVFYSIFSTVLLYMAITRISQVIKRYPSL